MKISNERRIAIISKGAQLRQLLARKKPIVAPGVYDPLGLKIVETLGFEVGYMGGWATGAHLMSTEPALTMTEQVDCARRAAKAVNIPLIVDGDAGFGDVIHTMRAVREFEDAGLAAIHIEDQVFPKRARYHANVLYILPLRDMIDKIKGAISARRDKDFLIIVRTDARGAVGGSLDEAIRRGTAFVDAGADVIMPNKIREPFIPPGTIRAEGKKFAEALSGIPLLWVDVWSGLSVEEIWDLGYQIIIYPLVGVVAAAKAVMDVYGDLKRFNTMKIDLSEFAKMQTKVQSIMGLPEYYAIEERLEKEEKERRDENEKSVGRR